jgi:hypothetical protein
MGITLPALGHSPKLIFLLYDNSVLIVHDTPLFCCLKPGLLSYLKNYTDNIAKHHKIFLSLAH